MMLQEAEHSKPAELLEEGRNPDVDTDSTLELSTGTGSSPQQINTDASNLASILERFKVKLLLSDFQVHTAKLKGSDQQVAVKVQHPHLEEWVPLDLALTRFSFRTF